MVNETEFLVNATNVTNSTIPHIAAAANPSILPWISDFWLFLIFFIVGLILYSFVLPEEVKRGVKSFLAKFWMPLLVFILWLYFRNRWGLVFEYPENFPGSWRRATFWAVFLSELYFLGKFFLYEERYNTNHLIVNNSCDSYARYENRGKWTIFYGGTSGKSTRWGAIGIIIPWMFPKRLYVVPRASWRKLGDQILIESQVKKADLEDLPEHVVNFIETDIFARFAKNEIYFGVWDQKIKASNPKYDELEEDLKKLNNRVNELVKMLKGKLEASKVFINETLAMTDKIKGKDWKSRREESYRDE